jgi:hypothetical protein
VKLTMDNNPNPNNNGSRECWPDLGPKVMSCRRLSGRRTIQARSVSRWNSWLEYYVITPFSCLIIPLITLGFFLKIVGDSGFDTLPRPAILAIVLSAAGVICWFAYVWPRYDYFVLHEDGLRIRIGFKRLHARFESIANVYNTIPESLIEAEYDRLGRYYEPETYLTDLPARMDATSIAVELTDGRTRVFRVLTRFESSDVARLLVAIRQRHEGWWPEPDA